jgi:hypothetical protein
MDRPPRSLVGGQRRIDSKREGTPSDEARRAFARFRMC